MAGARDRHAVRERAKRIAAQRAETQQRGRQLELQDAIALRTIWQSLTSHDARDVDTFAHIVLVYASRRDRRDDYRHAAHYVQLPAFDDEINFVLTPTSVLRARSKRATAQTA